MALKEKFTTEYTVPGWYIMINLTNRKKRKIYIHSKDESELKLKLYNLKFAK